MNWNLENQKLVNSYANRLSNIYDKAIKQSIGIGYSVTNYSTEKPFLFADFPGANKQADKLFSQTAYEIEAMINGGTQQAWMLGNVMSDGIVDAYFKNSGIPAEQLAQYYNRNLDALASFQTRVEDGVNLSDRVWKYTGQFKNEIELAIGVGIGEGKSASALSRDIREYLNEPKKLFHKIRNAHGELVLSKNAKAYHPGQGVYRSSYKNAMRVTRSEINMSYHQADNARWNSLDFVAGFHVALSNGHPQEDICDTLQGDYPKEFSFWGWHTQCMCHTTPILSPQNEFIGQMVQELKTGDTSGYIPSNTVEGLPENFKAWAAQNQDRIENAKTTPYFIDKNFKGKDVQEWFKQADKWAENAKSAANNAATKAAEAKAAKGSPEDAKKQAFYDASSALAEKKLAAAETLGLNTPGGAFEKLTAILKNEKSTYSQIDGAITKLNAEMKYVKSGEAAKAIEAAKAAEDAAIKAAELAAKKAAEEAAAAAIKAAEEAAALAEKLAAEAKQAGFMDYEVTYANKKLVEAETWGVTGANVDALKAVLEDKNATYSQISGKSTKLVKEIKAAKIAKVDPFSEPSLLKIYSKDEVNNLFNAYDNFNTNKLKGLSLEDKIKKLEFEVDWLAKNGKYSTSGVLKEMLQNDLSVLQKEAQLKADNLNLFKAIDASKSKISNSILTGDKDIIKAADALSKEVGKKTLSLEAINAKTEQLDKAFAAYYKKQDLLLAKDKIVFKDLSETEIKKLFDKFAVNSVDSVDAALRAQTEDIWKLLTTEERNVLTKYTQTYSYLNEPLRGLQYYGDVKPNAEHLRDMPLLTSALNKMKTLENMVVRRGTDSWVVKELGYGLDSLKAGDVFVDKGFSSTAIHPGSGFHNSFEFIIAVPEGATGIYAEPFSHYTDYNKFNYGKNSGSGNLWDGISSEHKGHELEWIGQRGSKYKVLKKDGKKIYMQLIGQLY